jgi:hypothetical protein
MQKKLLTASIGGELFSKGGVHKPQQLYFMGNCRFLKVFKKSDGRTLTFAAFYGNNNFSIRR